jgi:hypothetical protein
MARFRPSPVRSRMRSLKLGNGGQQRRQKPALRRRGVKQRIAKRSECGPSLADTLD